MSLEKQSVVSQIEVTESSHVQVRMAHRVLENGVVIAQNFERFVVVPGQDTTGMDPKVVAICQTVHTPEVIAAYEAQQAAQTPGA